MTFCIFNTVAEESDRRFFQAFEEIKEMLEEAQPLSVKRAAFLLEWAYLDGMLSYESYCHGGVTYEAYITFAPQHIFIRHRDELDSGKWVNVELTTQSLSREIFYIEKFE